MHASPRSFPVRSQLIRSGSAPVLWGTDNPRARQARAGSTAGQRRSAGTFESSSSPGSVKRGRKRGARYPDRRATRPLDQDFAVSPRICDGGRTTCGRSLLARSACPGLEDADLLVELLSLGFELVYSCGELLRLHGLERHRARARSRSRLSLFVEARLERLDFLVIGSEGLHGLNHFGLGGSVAVRNRGRCFRKWTIGLGGHAEAEGEECNRAKQCFSFHDPSLATKEAKPPFAGGLGFLIGVREGDLRSIQLRVHITRR